MKINKFTKSKVTGRRVIMRGVQKSRESVKEKNESPEKTIVQGVKMEARISSYISEHTHIH